MVRWCTWCSSRSGRVAVVYCNSRVHCSASPSWSSLNSLLNSQASYFYFINVSRYRKRNLCTYLLMYGVRRDTWQVAVMTGSDRLCLSDVQGLGDLGRPAARAGELLTIAGRSWMRLPHSVGMARIYRGVRGRSDKYLASPRERDVIAWDIYYC